MLAATCIAFKEFILDGCVREKANVTYYSVERGRRWSILVASKKSLCWILSSEYPIIWRVRWIGGCVSLVGGRTRQMRKNVIALPRQCERKTRWDAAHSLPRKPLTPRMHQLRLVCEETTVAASGRAFRMPVLGQFEGKNQW